MNQCFLKKSMLEYMNITIGNVVNAVIFLNQCIIMVILFLDVLNVNLENKLLNLQKKQSQLNIVNIFFSNILENDKTLIYPLELDIVIPEKKIAIEFNGIYWHKNKKGYHNMKSTRCEKIGYRLIHIWEDEWREKNNEIKGKT